MNCQPPFAREEEVAEATEDIIKRLNGFTLFNAIIALREAKRLLLLPHRVDAQAVAKADEERTQR